MACPKCGTVVDDSQSTCPNCGTALGFKSKDDTTPDTLKAQQSQTDEAVKNAKPSSPFDAFGSPNDDGYRPPKPKAKGGLSGFLSRLFK